MMIDTVYHHLDAQCTSCAGNDERGRIFADELAMHGYQIILNSVAAAIQPGDMIPVGSGEEVAPVSDPRPGLAADSERDCKRVRKHYRKVKFVGAPFTMISRDGATKACVRRVYFERSLDMQAPF